MSLWRAEKSYDTDTIQRIAHLFIDLQQWIARIILDSELKIWKSSHYILITRRKTLRYKYDTQYTIDLWFIDTISMKIKGNKFRYVVMTCRERLRYRYDTTNSSSIYRSAAMNRENNIRFETKNMKIISLYSCNTKKNVTIQVRYTIYSRSVIYRYDSNENKRTFIISLWYRRKGYDTGSSIYRSVAMNRENNIRFGTKNMKIISLYFYNTEKNVTIQV